MDFNDRKTGPDELEYSQEDKRFLKMVKENIRYVDGHCEVLLPFRTPGVVIPNNKVQAMKRANWQKSKMQRSIQMHTVVTTLIL